MERLVGTFLWKILLLSLPIAQLLLYVELQLRHVPNSYDTKRDFFEEQLEEIEVLILGSSQAYRGINPDHIAFRAFNLAMVSQSLYYDYHLLLKYIDRMKKLKYVVVTLSYFSFGYRMADSSERWRPYFYYHFWDISSSTLNVWDPKYVSYIALYGRRHVLEYAINRFDVNSNDILRNGFPNPTDDDNTHLVIDDISGKERVDLHHSLMKLENYHDNYETCSNMIALLRDRGIEVLLIRMPVYETYSRFVNPDFVERNRAIIYELAGIYNIKYLDFQAGNIFALSDYYDDDHLNKSGAKKLSEIINKELHVVLKD